MVKGQDFEVTKEEFERAKEAHPGCNGSNGYYMAEEDVKKRFDASIRWGYGLYDCRIREESGKYICSWWRGDSCD